jgi:hypothetical protein
MLKMETATVSCSVFKDIVVVRYLDHVQYSRVPALVMSPQTRETVGWLVYECEQYITLAYDRDVDPPTLKGGDPKASGLVLLKSDIIHFQRLSDGQLLPEEELYLNLQKHLQKNRVCAFNSTKRKTLNKQ